jgi:hypothetical protein
VANVIALQSGLIRLKKGKRGPAPKDKEGNIIGLGPITDAGESVNIVQGQLYDSNHPAVKMAPTMFGEPNSIHRSVEQATAAPGEKR